MARAARTRAPAKSGVRDDPASAYDMTHADEGEEQRTLACIVDNEPGVLARVVGLFAARGYNIESLTVAEIDRNAHQSRITIVTSGTNHVLEQIEQQLLRLVPVIKVIDVLPEENATKKEMGGYQWPISLDIFRGRYRNSFERPEPIPAGQVQRYRFRLPPMNHSFLPGHRIMVQVQSSLFPAYDRNPQTFVPNIFFAKPQDYRAATVTIERGGATPSAVLLPIVK